VTAHRENQYPTLHHGTFLVLNLLFRSGHGRNIRPRRTACHVKVLFLLLLFLALAGIPAPLSSLLHVDGCASFGAAWLSTDTTGGRDGGRPPPAWQQTLLGGLALTLTLALALALTMALGCGIV
jgi:hypothetical protein